MLAAESDIGRHQVEIRRVSGKIWRPFFSIWVAKPIYTLTGTPNQLVVRARHERRHVLAPLVAIVGKPVGV